jgi:hypothetical protein
MAALGPALFSLFQGGASLAGASAQSGAIDAKGQYEAQMYEQNARFAEINADDALKRGAEAAQQQLKRGAEVQGSQRAALAAQGIAIDSGSAADIQADTAALAAQDAMKIQNNAWREAWGYRVQANDYRGKAELTKLGAKTDSANTLLAGGMKAAAFTADGISKLPNFNAKTSENPFDAKKGAARMSSQSYYNPRNIG